MLFTELIANTLTQDARLFICLRSLTVKFARVIPLVGFGGGSFILTGMYCPIMRTHHALLIPSTSDRHSGSLRFCVTMITATTYILVLVFFGEHILRSGSAGAQIGLCSVLCRHR